MKKETKALGVYRLVSDKENGDWVIRRDNSEKASRRFKTKAEAEKALKELAKNQNIGFTIKKLNGHFQKKK